MTRGHVVAVALALCLLVAWCAAAILSQTPNGVQP